MADEIVIQYPPVSPVDGQFRVGGDHMTIVGHSSLPVSSFPSIMVSVTRPEYKWHMRAPCDADGNWILTNVPLIQGTFEVPIQLDAFEADNYSASLYHAKTVPGILEAIKIPAGYKIIVLSVIDNAFKMLAPSLPNVPLTIKAYDGPTSADSTVFATPVHVTLAIPTSINVTEPAPDFIADKPYLDVIGTTTGNPTKVKVKLEY